MKSKIILAVAIGVGLATSAANAAPRSNKTTVQKSMSGKASASSTRRNGDARAATRRLNEQQLAMANGMGPAMPQTSGGAGSGAARSGDMSSGNMGSGTTGSGTISSGNPMPGNTPQGTMSPSGTMSPPASGTMSTPMNDGSMPASPNGDTTSRTTRPLDATSPSTDPSMPPGQSMGSNSGMTTGTTPPPRR